MTPLRILNVTQAFPPFVEASGQALKVQAISRHLARRGHRVTVLTAELGRLGVRSVELRAKTWWGRWVQCNAVEALYLRTILQYRMMTIHPGVIPFCLRRLREFDVVHIYGLYDFLGPVVALFCRRWRVPYMLEPLGMFRPIVRNIVLKRFYLSMLGWPLVRGAGRVIATSALEHDELIADGVQAEQIVVRRNGVDLAEFDPLPPRGRFRREIGLSDRQPIVLYLGRLSHKKGLDLLLEAFHDITDSAALAIVGPDDGDGCLQQVLYLRERLGLAGRVHVLGPRFGAAKVAALVDADVFVLPSRSENFGNAAAEAIACGVPVVVTDRCGIAPLVKDRAGLVVPCEVNAIRAALSWLIEDPSLRARFRAGAAEVRQELSWDEPVEQMERLYTEILKR